jgi:hypothetical protein
MIMLEAIVLREHLRVALRARVGPVTPPPMAMVLSCT